MFGLKQNSVTNSFHIQMSRDFISTKREIYTFTDLLMDVGGFAEAIRFFCEIAMYLLRMHKIDLHLIEHLYKK